MDATSPALGRSRAPASPLSRPRISSCASVDRDTSRAASTRLLLPPEGASGSARAGAGGSPRGLGRGDPELGGQPWTLKEGRKGDLAHNLWVLAPGRERTADAVAGRRVLMLRGLGGTMPFPPPPVPAPGVPAARPPPRRPAAPRKLAATTCAPPGPSPPAAAGEKKRRPPERPEVLPSRSWPSATLKRPPARRAPGPAPPRTPAPAAPGRPHTPVTAGAGDSPAGSAASGPGPDAAVRFSLSLTPEAVLVIQRRHLEKQLLARPRRPLPSPSADARRLLTPGPRARAAGPRRGGDPGGLDARPPGFPRLPGGLQAPDPCLRRLLKVSLLNDRHKYDDVEYEEEAAAVDESLVRKCTEWLRGVESAAAARDGTGPLDALPHLSML